MNSIGGPLTVEGTSRHRSYTIDLGIGKMGDVGANFLHSIVSFWC